MWKPVLGFSALGIAIIVSLVCLNYCFLDDTYVTKGMVIAREYHPQVTTFTVVANGKTMIPVPIIIPERWTLDVAISGFLSSQSYTVSVDESTYRLARIGSIALVQYGTTRLTHSVSIKKIQLAD